MEDQTKDDYGCTQISFKQPTTQNHQIIAKYDSLLSRKFSTELGTECVRET